MTRLEEIKERAKHEDSDGYFGFLTGAEWSDNHPLPCMKCEKYKILMERWRAMAEQAVGEVQRLIGL